MEARSGEYTVPTSVPTVFVSIRAGVAGETVQTGTRGPSGHHKSIRER